MIKGYITKPNNIPPEKNPRNQMAGVAILVADLRNLKKDTVKKVDEKLGEIDDRIESLDQTIVDSQQKVSDLFEEAQTVLNDTAEEALQIIKETKQGEPGQNADEEKIIEEVLSRIPLPEIDEEKIVATVLSRVPPATQIDEELLFKKFLKKIPQDKSNASLKIIQETFETDPMSVIDKIMQLPEDKFKIKSSQIEGLEQTIRAFHNQLGRGYLHGGGISNITGLVQAGTNITITGSGTASSPYIINSTGGGGTPSLPLNSIQYNNAGAFGGSANLTFNGSIFSLTGVLSQGGGAVGFNVGIDDFFLRTTAYSDGLLYVNNSGQASLGDWLGDINATQITVDDSLSTIQYVANNGHTFTGGLTLNAFAGGGTQYLTVDNSGVVGVSAGSGGALTVGTTTIASGTTTRILYDNAGVLGEYTITGTGTVVAMQTSPTFVTDITTPKVIGGVGSGGNLTLSSTSHATKGAILMGAVSEYDEVNERFGVGTLTPQSRVDVTTDGLGTTQTNTSGLLLANTTLATAGVVRQISPAIRWRAHAWKSNATAASQTVDFRQYANATHGTATVTGDIVWESSINGGAYTTLMGLGSSGVLTFYTANTRVIDVSASSTTIIGLRIQNQNNSTASSIARNEITVGGSSGGDPQTNYVVSGATDWVTGIDNSDSDSFKLSQNATLGTNDRFIMTVAGLFSLRTGLSTKRATVGGKIKEFITSIGNVGTGEDDLYTYTTEANILGTDGDEISGSFGLKIATSGGTATRQVKLWFGGTAIFDTTALLYSAASGAVITYTIVRVSSTSVRYRVSLTTQGATLAAYTSVNVLTGLTLSNTNILKLTGEAAGVGAATDDIIAHSGSVLWHPVSL